MSKFKSTNNVDADKNSCVNVNNSINNTNSITIVEKCDEYLSDNSSSQSITTPKASKYSKKTHQSTLSNYENEVLKSILTKKRIELEQQKSKNAKVSVENFKQNPIYRSQGKRELQDLRKQQIEHAIEEEAKENEDKKKDNAFLGKLKKVRADDKLIQKVVQIINERVEKHGLSKKALKRQRIYLPNEIASENEDLLSERMISPKMCRSPTIRPPKSATYRFDRMPKKVPTEK